MDSDYTVFHTVFDTVFDIFDTVFDIFDAVFDFFDIFDTVFGIFDIFDIFDILDILTSYTHHAESTRHLTSHTPRNRNLDILATHGPHQITRVTHPTPIILDIFYILDILDI